MCCHDGVWLTRGEVRALHRVVFRFRARLGRLTGAYLAVDTADGGKTATRPAVFRARLPAHFTPSRCVFGADDGRCRLETLARDLELHPWSFKPRACWLHPLRLSAGGAVPPPASSADDPDATGPAYPGFLTFTGCGSHHEDGLPWEELLAEELAFLRAGRRGLEDWDRKPLPEDPAPPAPGPTPPPRR